MMIGYFSSNAFWNKLLTVFYINHFALIITLPSPNPKPLFYGVSHYLSPLFERLAYWTATTVFQVEQPILTTFISDATILYIHVFNTFIIALFLSLILLFFKNKILTRAWWEYSFTVLVRYYVASQMLIYGCSKVFKWQFYAPEPNILYTNLGELSPDILYWSTMGSSYTYTVFGGILELLVAVFLLFKRTKLLGALLGIGVLTNIVAINFGYNISVKLYSVFLLISCIYLAGTERKRLFYFFFRNEKTLPEASWSPTWTTEIQVRLYRIFKTLTIGIMLINALFLYLSTNNFNDDKAPRPVHHGAYQVDFFIKNNDTIPPLLADTTVWKRFFIHRKNYFIIQKMDNTMQDFELIHLAADSLALWDTSTKKTVAFSVFNQEEKLILDNKALRVEASKVNLNTLPFSKKGFDWTVDSFFRGE